MREESAAPSREVAALFSRGSVYTAATALQLSVGVLVLPAVTRLLSQGAYGKVATALVLLQILTYVAALGLPYAITLEFFDRRGGVGAAQTLLVICVGTSLAITAVVDLLGPWWTSNLLSGVRYDLPLRLTVWSAAPTALMLAVQALLRSQNRMKEFVVVTLLGTAGAQLLGLALVAGVHRSASAYLGGVAGGLVVAAIVGLTFTGMGVVRVRERRLLLAALQLGLPTVPHALAIYIVSAGDRLIVQRQLGLEAVARYQVAYLVGALGLTLVSALNNAWAPLVYGASDERRWSILAETTAAVYRLASVVVAGIAAGAPLALLAVAPHSYRPTDLTPVSAVVALSMVAYVGYFANAHVIFYSRRAWSLAWATPLSAALNVGLNLALIPHFGLMGSAYATVAAYGVQAMLADRVRRRIADVPWERGAAVTSIAFALTVVAASALVPADGVWLVARAPVAAGMLMLFTYRLRGFLRGRAGLRSSR